MNRKPKRKWSQLVFYFYFLCVCVFNPERMCWHLLDCGGRVFLGLLASRLKLSSIWAEFQNLNPIYQDSQGSVSWAGACKAKHPSCRVFLNYYFFFILLFVHVQTGPHISGPKHCIAVSVIDVHWPDSSVLVLIGYLCVRVCASMFSPDRRSHTHRSCPALSRVDPAFIQTSTHRDRGNTGTMNLTS